MPLKNSFVMLSFQKKSSENKPKLKVDLLLLKKLAEELVLLFGVDLTVSGRQENNPLTKISFSNV